MIAANRLHNISEYYFSKKLREVRDLISEGKPVINMGIGSPDLPPSQIVIEALNDASMRPGSHRYQSYQGLLELREAFADYYRKYYDVSVNVNTEVLPLMGSKEGILHISMAFLNIGDEVLIPNPGYPTYGSVTRLVGAKPVYYKLSEADQWLPDLDRIAGRDLSKVKLMWVNYPHMPTGKIMPHKGFKEIVEFAKTYDILIVNDNPYSHILNDTPQSILTVEGAKDVALELNSLSKSFNISGWRVGMVLGREDHISNILKVKSNMDSGMYYGIQKGAVEALSLSDEWFTSLDSVYGKRRELVFDLADKLECSYDKDTAGLFVWAKLKRGSGSSEQFTDELLYRHHIFVAPGTIFGSQGEGYIRFSICVEEPFIKQAIDRL